ncbi:uncharacterized protein L199_002341 [Kwoniella botswanensis]|uniref:uncharacterized protein n=1 Tax=Kwoniella botswanensis TaxID=1268659 RepID=UPI00315CDB2A
MPPSAITSSPLKYRQPVTRQRSAEPFAPPVPAKPIDLNSSTKSTDRETGQKITRRAFLCDIVVENQGEGIARCDPDPQTAKVAVHIDEEGLAENLPIGEDAPLLCIRLQPMTGGLCRFSYSTVDAVDEDRMVIDISEIIDRIVTTGRWARMLRAQGYNV